jgi:hypothetical protein
LEHDLGGYFMQTDDRGIYRLYGLPAGRYLISAGSGGGPGEMPMRIGGVSITKRTYYPDSTEESQAKAIEVTPGSEAKDIDIRLASETVKGYASRHPRGRCRNGHASGGCGRRLWPGSE